MPTWAREFDGPGFVIVGGRNYGQGSSREHAAIAPRYLGLQVVCAISWGRIHWQNPANFGILPLTFANSDDYEAIESGDELKIDDVFSALDGGDEVTVENRTQGTSYTMTHGLSARQMEMIRAGSLVRQVREAS